MVDPDARTHQPIVFVNLCVWLSVTVFLPLLALVRAILFCRLCIFFFVCFFVDRIVWLSTHWALSNLIWALHSKEFDYQI